uniref:Transcriptional regulator n=1 Tax=Fervidobacterium pennivorans TaxID=93466 RepID=A0A7V4KDX8_FERPE
MLYIKLFGDWKVYKYGNEFNDFTSKKALKLLFYILLSGRSKVSVEELLRTFWPGYTPEYSRKNLNAQLYYIRKDLEIPYDYLRNERDYVFINLSYFPSDYSEFMKAIDNADAKKASELYTGLLLEGFEDDWVRKHRIRCQRLYEELLKVSSKTETENPKVIVSSILKAKILLEHQKATREKYFIPIALKKDYVKEIKVRKGDIVLDLGDKLFLILERGTKRAEEVIFGFAKRLGLDLSYVVFLSEEDVLNQLDSNIA